MGTALGIGELLPTQKGKCPLLYYKDLLKNGSYSKTRTYFCISDGTEIAASTLMEILLKNDFKLVIDKITYDVQCPKKGKKHSCELSYISLLLWAFFQGAGLS